MATSSRRRSRRGDRDDLHALRRAHHRHLRRLHRRGHPDHRRAPRAGRRARRRRLCARDRPAGLRGGDRRPGHDECGDRRRQRVPRREPDAADRRSGRARASTGWARCRTCRTSTSCGRSRSSPPRCRAPSASPTSSSMAFARSVQRRVRPVVPRDPARRARRQGRSRRKRWFPTPGTYRASTKSIGDPADIERLADILVQRRAGRALSASRSGPAAAPTRRVEFVEKLNIPAYMNGAGRGTLAARTTRSTSS